MDNITNAYFRSLFDEFAPMSDAKVNAYITIASSQVPPTVWNDQTSYATALMVAHMLTASGYGGLGAGGGAVTNEQVGDVSRGYGQVGNAESGDAYLATTRYGIDFIALRRRTIVPGMVTGPAVTYRPIE